MNDASTLRSRHDATRLSKHLDAQCLPRRSPLGFDARHDHSPGLLSALPPSELHAVYLEQQRDNPDSQQSATLSLPPGNSTQSRSITWDTVPNHAPLPPVISAQSPIAGHNAFRKLPLPTRPTLRTSFRKVTKNGQRSDHASGSRKEEQLRPYTMNVAAAAPRLADLGHLDLHPWLGTHAEDQYSEAAIRQGFYDKAQMLQNETASAKSVLLPALNQKGGLQAMSALLTNVMLHRRKHGKITSASTFKPPPRLTVTDTRRETWLKDLSNPCIPLRRLSRSIPHGIRGRALLEQCLSKRIPYDRAIWFTKCVGANELRSFRRKGTSATFSMGSEIKWVRDLTIAVEQFLEFVIETCGQQQFSERFDYTIRLVTHLYTGQLLDGPYFLEWLVSGLDRSPQHQLPGWLLLLRIYMQDLVVMRTLGRRVVEALLKHHTEVQKCPSKETMAHLQSFLQKTLLDLYEFGDCNFVGVNDLTILHDASTVLASMNSPPAGYGLSALAERNRRLGRSCLRPACARRTLLKSLDQSLSRGCSTELALECWNSNDDKQIILRIVLDWACSLYRPHIQKVFVAVYLLQSWKSSLPTLTEDILDHVDKTSCQDSFDYRAFYLLISELTTTHLFLIPNYFRWLIVRGGTRNSDKESSTKACTARLLIELADMKLDLELANLHKSLLGRAGYTTAEQARETEICMDAVVSRFRAIKDHGKIEALQDLDAAKDFDRCLLRLGRHGLSIISGVLLIEVKTFTSAHDPTHLTSWHTSSGANGTSTSTQRLFAYIVDLLERISDYNVLAAILRAFVALDDPTILALCTNTICSNLVILTALGHATELFHCVVQGFQRISSCAENISKILLLCLRDLSQVIPGAQHFFRDITHRLLQVDVCHAVNARSPVSDHTIPQTTQADFIESVEASLATGTTLDAAQMCSLFSRVWSYSHDSVPQISTQQRLCNLLLAKLRSFGRQHFDELIRPAIKVMILSQKRQDPLETFRNLVCYDCVTFQAIHDAYLEAIEETMQHGEDAGSLVHEMALLIIGSPDDPQSDILEMQRFSMIRARALALRSQILIQFLGIMLRSGLLNDIKAANATSWPKLTSMLMAALTQEMSSSVMYDLNRSDEIQLKHWLLLQPMLDEVLRPWSPGIGTKIDFPVLFRLCNDLSYPLCRLKFQSMLATEAFSGQTSEESASAHPILDPLLEQAAQEPDPSCTELLRDLEGSRAEHIYLSAANSFLKLIPEIASGASGSSSSQAVCITAFMDAVAEHACQNMAVLRAVQAGLLRELEALRVGLIKTKTATPDKMPAFAQAITLLIMCYLKHVLVLEKMALTESQITQAFISLASIYLDLKDLCDRTHCIRNAFGLVQDAAFCSADQLRGEQRQVAARALGNGMLDPSLQYMCSISPNTDAWLLLQLAPEQVPSASLDASSRREGHVPKPYPLKRWELLREPGPNMGENDTSLSLTLFEARRLV